MPEYIKLTEPGSSITFKLMGVTLDTKGKWPDYILATADGRHVQAPKAAIDRQLAGCNVQTIEQLIGSYITYGRSEKVAANGNPYHNLSVSSAGEAKQSATPSKRLAPPAQPAPPVVNAFDAMVPDDDLPPEPPELMAQRTAVPAAWLNGGTLAVVVSDVTKYTGLMQEIATALGCKVTEPNVQGAAATLWIQWHRGR